MSSPEERLRLLDPAQERYALDLLDGLARGVIHPAPIDISGLARDVTAAIAQRDAFCAAFQTRLAVLQEAVEVLADLDSRDFKREVSPKLALLLATEWRKRVNGGGGLTPEDFLEAMVADGLRVRGDGGG